MLQISALPLFHFLANFYLLAQAVIFTTILTMMLRSRFADKSERKMILANASSSNRIESRIRQRRRY